jgi:hypothetical protein
VDAVPVHPENEESAMLETKLSVPVYGHVRQYHNLKAEIDAKIQEVLESGQSVMGADAEALQGGIDTVPCVGGMPTRTAAMQRWLAFRTLGMDPGDEDHEHVFRGRRAI